jgi:hypothetical protein
MKRPKGDQGLFPSNPKERDYLEDLGVDRRTILKWNSRSKAIGIDGIILAQDRDRWRVLANRVMILPVPQTAGNFLTN